MRYENGDLEYSFERFKMSCFIIKCNSTLQTRVLKMLHQFYQPPNLTIRLSDINFNLLKPSGFCTYHQV